METRQIQHRTTPHDDSPDSSTSAALSDIQANCQRLADAADAEIERALSGGFSAEQFNQSTRQLTGGQ